MKHFNGGIRKNSGYFIQLQFRQVYVRGVLRTIKCDMKQRPVSKCEFVSALYWSQSPFKVFKGSTVVELKQKNGATQYSQHTLDGNVKQMFFVDGFKY